MSRLNLPCFRSFVPLLAAAALLVPARVAAADNPFAPPPTAPGAAAGPLSDTYQLSGYVAQAKGDGMISVTRVSDKRSLWISLGQTVGDITAVRYDAINDQAVIRVGGQNLTISLRKAATKPGTNIVPVVASAPLVASTASSVPTVDPTLPPQPPPPAPGTQAFKEQEARMLVTDLLEIGLEQRKAYEAAQREAAARGGRAAQAEPAATSAH